jgi:integrase
MIAMGGRVLRQRRRGQVEVLPSGALRVTVYSGIDPLIGRRVYLR